MQDWVESVSFALLHHPIGRDHNFVLISYIPEGASGLRRGPYLVDLRSIFLALTTARTSSSLVHIQEFTVPFQSQFVAWYSRLALSS